jgi:putative aminopeptidase FrvX
MHILDEELYQAGMALAACPTAPCHEGHVRACLLERLAGLPHLTTRLDEFGNLHAHYEHDSAGRTPFRLVAHLDHPAFVVDRSGTAAALHFAGGVAEGHFVGRRIVFHRDRDRRALGRATVTAIDFSGEIKRVAIDGTIPAEADFAVWNLPKARCTKRLFLSPACDDLAQAATVLALLRRLALAGAPGSVHALFTRAEEIGFAGAFAALKGAEALGPMPTLSLECSQTRGFARVDAGPIVRVGDRLSVFDSAVTHWIETAFRDLQGVRPGTVWQRLLMGGGACEGSVFHRAGLPTGALCVALNNYHNMGPQGTIRAESISLRDWQGLYDFLFFLATEAKSPAAADQNVAERFAQLEERGLAALRQTPLRH